MKKSNAHTVKQSWESYLHDVVPPRAPAIQVTECHRAFYAGAFAMFGLVAMAGEPGINQSISAAYLESLRQECLTFAEAVKKGKA